MSHSAPLAHGYGAEKYVSRVISVPRSYPMNNKVILGIVIGFKNPGGGRGGGVAGSDRRPKGTTSQLLHLMPEASIPLDIINNTNLTHCQWRVWNHRF